MFKRLRKISITATDGGSQRGGDDDFRATVEKNNAHPRKRRNSLKLLVAKFWAQSFLSSRSNREGGFGGVQNGLNGVGDDSTNWRGFRQRRPRLSEDTYDEPSFASPTTTSLTSKALRRISGPSQLRARTLSSSSDPSHTAYTPVHYHAQRHSVDDVAHRDSLKIRHNRTNSSASASTKRKPPPSSNGLPHRSLRRTTRISASSVNDANERRYIAVATGITIPSMHRTTTATGNTGISVPVIARRHSSPARGPNSGAGSRNGDSDGDYNNNNVSQLNGTEMGLDRAMHSLSVEKDVIDIGDEDVYEGSHRGTMTSYGVPLPLPPPNGEAKMIVVSRANSPDRSEYHDADESMPTVPPELESPAQPSFEEIPEIIDIEDSSNDDNHSDSIIVLGPDDEPPPLPPKDGKWSIRSPKSIPNKKRRGRKRDRPAMLRIHYPGVKFRTADRQAESYNQGGRPVLKPEDILTQVWERTTRTEEEGEKVRIKCKELLHSSFGHQGEVQGLSSFVPQKNGFVHTVLDAYNYHHHLVIRPDDVWIAILSQLSIYVNAHAEEVRHVLVSHEGKKVLVVEADTGTRHTADFGWFTRQMGELLRTQVNDERLLNFIVPKFSTTTENDVVVASAMMMSTLKAYFSYVFYIRCGIPTVTLLGDKADYEEILARLSCLLPPSDDASRNVATPLLDLGEEVQAFAHLLLPIIRQFANAFDGTPNHDKANSGSRIENVTLNAEGADFWGRICHVKHTGSGPSYLSGWLSAFCVWDEKGAWQGPDPSQIIRFSKSPRPRSRLSTKSAKSSRSYESPFSPPPALHYAGFEYPVIKLSSIPPGFCDVNVLLNEMGTEFDCTLVAGHIGMVVGAQTGEDYPPVVGKGDTLMPAPQWFFFIKEKVRDDGYVIDDE